ncbi:DUF2200 domain-containing protein [Demequina gelatinilytica]|uniref:DUF2200 domain-containing protein n=1 Tax=Demequina gelatinilytica TaxID=1638980 RepID=UPI0007805715|nr:DUF2200 domain-containing protein [Demequina gelatinilytica]
MSRHKIFDMPFARIYPEYVKKVERKDHTVDELHTVLTWLTGYSDDGIADAVADERTLEQFFASAPAMNDHTDLITGVICGVRVEEIEDPLMQQIRWMDKLVDEVARGKRMASILRAPKA